MKVLVTGANGFVGRHLIAELAQRRIVIHALVRRVIEPLPAGVVPFVMSSFEDSLTLERACAGCTSIVHLGARVHVRHERTRDPLTEYRRTNVEGTRALLEVGARTGVNRFLLVSTIKVNGEGSDQRYTALSPPQPVDPYAVSKLEAEETVRGFDSSMETVILRPPLVYGPGVGGNFLRLLRMTIAARVIPLPLGGLRNRRSLVYVGNLVDAIVHLLQAPAARGRTFLVSDGEDLCTTELIERLGHAAGVVPRTFSVPPQVLRMVGRVVGKGPDVDRLAGSLTIDASALRSTGWAPPYSVDEGLLETVRWWQARERREMSKPTD